MNDNYLEHIGMPRRSGRYPWGSGKRPFQGDSAEDLSEISSEELQTKINRIRLEKQYRDLITKPKTVSKGRQILTSILENSSKNIGTQLATYFMGNMVNSVAKALGSEADIVNPKKGQKDK